MNQVVATTRERLAGLDVEQLSWQPEPGAWSVAECLAHLLATNSGYLSSIATVLEARPRSPKDADAPFRGGALAARFIRQSGPEVKRKYKNPEVFAPRSADLGPDVVSAFLVQQDELLRLLKAAEGADLTRAKVPSPASSLIRFRLGDAFRLIVEHEKRHLLQATRVMAAPGFGRG